MTHFLKPRLIGDRFKGGVIPLEILNDISALREMIIDVAKWRYMADHPERERLPKKFAENVSLNLVGVDEGSAIPLIDIAVHAPGSPDAPELPGMPSEVTGYFVSARDSIIDAIYAAERGEAVLDHLTQRLLRHFNRIGTRLRGDESFVFEQPNTKKRANLNQVTRHRLLDASAIKELAEEVTVRGSIPEVDQDRMSFELMLANGRKLVVRMLDHELDTILDTSYEYSTNAKVMIRGIGRYDRDRRLAKLETIDEVVPLDPLDVPARIDELRELQDGWLDGEGLALDGAGLDWLSDGFDELYPSEAPLPRLYPTPEGGVQAEWSFPPHNVNLEIDLVSRQGEWFIFDMESDADEEVELDLNDVTSWRALGDKMASLSMEQA